MLIKHIEEKHHGYIKQAAPILQAYLDKICRVHGENHTELFDIREQFSASVVDLTVHMKKEESKLFPYIRKMVTAKNNHENIERPGFGIIKNPISVMIQEHDNEDHRYEKIARLTNNYITPEDACNSYKKTFSLLQEFENDLRKHMELENTILFPRAIALDQEFIKI
jgi:regulator of cell morphogenesis and NO signaling